MKAALGELRGGLGLLCERVVGDSPGTRQGWVAQTGHEQEKWCSDLSCQAVGRMLPSLRGSSFILVAEGSGGWMAGQRA